MCPKRFDNPISATMRKRAWIFSSANPGVVPVNDAARKGTAGGALATGGAAAQQSAASGADWITVALIILAAIAIAAGAWVFWHWRRKRRQEAAA